MVNVSEFLKTCRDKNFNAKKFKQVLHYIIDRTSSFDNVGKKVLYKMLYFNDFNYYELYEEKLTGEVYAKLDHGPAPRDFDSIVDELKDEGKVEERDAIYFGKPQKRYLSLERPDVSCLSAVELQHLDDTISRYGKMNGTQIEALSHDDIPWKAAEPYQDLDYELVFYRSLEMSIREYPDD